MWRVDETELVADPPVGQGALVVENPQLPETWWEGLNASLDAALAAQETPRLATPDTESITQDLVDATIREVFPKITDLAVDEWDPAHADLTWANVTGPGFCIIDWEDWEAWGMAPRGLDAAPPRCGETPRLFRAWRTACGVSRGRPGVQVRPADGAVLLREGRGPPRTRGGSAVGTGAEGSRPACRRASVLLTAVPQEPAVLVDRSLVDIVVDGFGEFAQVLGVAGAQGDLVDGG